jgi:hypothetical protein
LPNLEEKNIVFLSEEVFHRPAFPGQMSKNVFDSPPLLNELNRILVKLYSEENLDFLKDIHALNSNRKISAEEMQAGLAKIEAKYITGEAHLNITKDTLTYISSRSTKTLQDYATAIAEVFELINSNVMQDKHILLKSDPLYTQKVIADFSGELDKIIKVPVTDSPLKHQGLFGSKVKDNLDYFQACQKDCLAAQQQLMKVGKDPALEPAERERMLKIVIHSMIEKLAKNYQFMQAYEAQRNPKEKIAVYIEKIIAIASSADTALSRVDPEMQRVSATRKSGTTVPAENTPSNLHERSVSGSLEKSFSSSPEASPQKSAVQPREYKKSSRALPPLIGPPTRKKRGP